MMTMQDPKLDYWWQRTKDGNNVWQRLQKSCREAGIEVMYTIMESLTQDGRDRSLDYKISGADSLKELLLFACAISRVRLKAFSCSQRLNECPVGLELALCHSPFVDSIDRCEELCRIPYTA